MSYLETTEVPQTDEEILEASVKNPALFSLLVDRYQEPLLRAAFGIVRQKEEAEDIVQESLTKIYLHTGKFQKQENASFKSWAYRIVINNAISHYRKVKRIREHQTPLDPEIYENLPGKENFQERTEAKILADQLLASVPEDLRRAIELYYMEGKSYKIIAEEEGIPLSTLKMRLFRAKKLIKNFIQLQA
jgi:RNA polymerase sigma-70 factor (ECF subfamily)